MTGNTLVAGGKRQALLCATSIPSDGPLLTTRQLAQQLNVHESWLRQLRVRGGPDAIPYVRLGRTVRYRVDDVRDWLEKHVVVSTADAERRRALAEARS